MNRDYLWSVAFATFVFGDLVTTFLGLELGLVEKAPLYQDMHASFPAVAIAAKLVTVAFALSVYRFVPDPARLGIPIGLALLGTAVTLWNSFLILSVV